MGKSINRKRKPQKANLAGLMVVSSDIAFDVATKKWKKEVYGIVSKDVPFISKTVIDRHGNKKRKFVNDITNLPNVTKERVMSFFDNEVNKKREKCYLVDKSLFDQYYTKNGKKQ